MSEGATRKLDDLESSMLTSFHQCVEDDKEVPPLMKAAKKKVQAVSALNMKGSGAWRKYKSVKAILVNQMMPY